MVYTSEYRGSRSKYLIYAKGERNSTPSATSRSFYSGGTSGHFRLGEELEAEGKFRAAGIWYVKQGKMADAARCAKKCVNARQPVDGAALYLEAGLPHKALECIQKCTGEDAFNAAALLMGFSEVGAAEECARRYLGYLKTRKGAEIGSKKKEVLVRIFSLTQNVKMANKFL